MAREVFNPNATDGDGDGMVQDGTQFERPAEPEFPEGFKPDAKDGDGDGMIQDGTEFERPVEEAGIVPETTKESDDAVIKSAEPVETQPAITNDLPDGVIGTGITKKRAPKKPEAPADDVEKVALFSDKNVRWEGVGRVLRGYNFVEAEEAKKWLDRSFIRLATPEEIKQEFGK